MIVIFSLQSNAAELSVLLEQMLQVRGVASPLPQYFIQLVMSSRSLYSQEVTDRTGLQYLKKFGSTLKTINPSCCTNGQSCVYCRCETYLTCSLVPRPSLHAQKKIHYSSLFFCVCGEGLGTRLPDLLIFVYVARV